MATLEDNKGTALCKRIASPDVSCCPCFAAMKSPQLFPGRYMGNLRCSVDGVPCRQTQPEKPSPGQEGTVTQVAQSPSCPLPPYTPQSPSRGKQRATEGSEARRARPQAKFTVTFHAVMTALSRRASGQTGLYRQCSCQASMGCREARARSAGCSARWDQASQVRW